MPAKNYYRNTEPISGYFLEEDQGWFSVLVPMSLTTLNTNPSFESGLAGVTAANSSIARVSTYQRRGVYSMQVTPSSTAAAGVYWLVTTETGGQYSCGLDLLAPGGQLFDLYFADSSGNRISRIATVRGANYWRRVWVNYAEVTGASRRVVLTKRAGGNVQPFYADGVNIVPTQYKTAYFDGDRPGFLTGQTPFFWNGTPHASTFRGDLQRYIQAGSTEFYVSQGENNISALMTETDANSAISAWWTPEYLSIDAAAR